MRSLRPILLSWLWILATANNESDLETIDLLENQNGTTEETSEFIQAGDNSNLTSGDCGVPGWDTVESCGFWMEGVMLTCTGIIGLIGNTLSIVILSKPDMYNSFNNLLITLSTMDSVFIVLAIFDYSVSRAFKWSTKLFVYAFPYIIYPLNQVSFCASIFTTVAMAYERHCAVCKPIHYRNVTTRYSVKRRTLSYIIPVVLLSIILNIPKFMETKFEWTAIHKHPNGTEIESLAESTTANYSAAVIDYKIELGVTALRDDPDYIRYYINWTRLITTGIIPVALLIYFNYGIFRGIQMTHERVKKKNKQRASEINLAVMLLCIVFFFLVCHFPRILLNVHEFFMLEDMISCGPEFIPPVWFFCTTSFNHWLLILNASCNFLIYVSVGDKFKTTIKDFCQSKLGCCFNHISCFKPQPENSPYVSNKSEMNSEKCVPMTLIGTKTESPEGVTTSLTIRGSQNQLQTYTVETVVEMNQINNGHHECNGHYNNLTNGETVSTERTLLSKTDPPLVSNSDEQVLI